MTNPFKWFWSRLSLAQKSILVGSFLLICNSVILTVVFDRIQERYLLSDLEDDGLATARAIAEICEYGIITRNRDVLNSNLSGMLAKNVRNIRVMDASGNIMAEAIGSEGPVPDEINTVILRSRMSNISSTSKNRVTDDKGFLRMLVIEHPIEITRRPQREEIGLLLQGERRSEKELIGSAVVVMDTRHMYLDLANNRKTFAFITAMVIGVGILIIIVFVELTAYPLKRLVVATHKVSEGDLGYKVRTSSMDEIGKLARSFNMMLEKLKEAQEKLVMSERLAAAGRLARDVAHEINNPLAIMKNYIYIIGEKKMKEDDPNQQFLRIIDGEIDRVAKIIRSFNDFYKGTQATTVEEVDPVAALGELLAFCREDLEAKGIAVEERIAEVGKVMADKDKLKQVFLNLIKNACEAMPDGGRLTVETKKIDGKVSVSVTDTGVGIDKENLGKIFNPFFSTKGVKGTGLGLSVSYGIIKNFNGDIEVESEVGKGTTFTVVLPEV